MARDRTNVIARIMGIANTHKWELGFYMPILDISTNNYLTQNVYLNGCRSDNNSTVEYIKCMIESKKSALLRHSSRRLLLMRQ